MPLLDYKFNRITETADGTTVVLSVYRGEMQDVVDEDGNVKNQYVRAERLTTTEYQFGKGIPLDAIRQKLNTDLLKRTQGMNTGLSAEKAYAPIKAQEVKPV